jgi:hypothetical protein
MLIWVIFLEVTGLKRCPFSIVSTIEELLQRESSSSGLENRDYFRRGIRRADYATILHPQNLALTSPTSGGRSFGIVRSRTQVTEWVYVFCLLILENLMC